MPEPLSTEAKVLAANILAHLGQDFTLPEVDLNQPEFSVPDVSDFSDAPLRVGIDELTEAVVDGNGAFDRVMTSQKAHLQEQFEKGRITGDQYVKAYIELTTASLNAGVNMVLQAEQGYWQAKLLQMQGRRAEVEAITSLVQLEIAKAELAKASREAALMNAQYVLAVMQLAREDANYRLTEKQILQQVAQTDLTIAQRENVLKETQISDYRLDNTLPQELANLAQQENVLHAQEALIKEQREVQRGQTLDIRSDGTTPVTGSIGKQKELYDQQIDSYRKDAEQKVAKMFLDGWITQKTLDEGLSPPNQLTNAQVDAVLAKIRETHEMMAAEPSGGT